MTLRDFILLFGLGLTAAKLTGEKQTEANEGHDWDIIEINKEAGLDLLEGDIMLDDTVNRNTRLGDQYRWPTTVPYYLENSLEMNAKGVIMKVFDQFRLKTCFDFTPWKGEDNYISVFKESGCWSYVGNRHMGKQNLSIGENCDRVGTVEHEFLHALGFWHEQSRADRDDYIDIIWKQIDSDNRNNFESHNDTESTALGVPYDYNSVMHYSKTAFSTGSEPTIVTKNPHFLNVIGQRIGFSASDMKKLNRLYNCTRSTSFVDSCDFEDENICGMIQVPGRVKWEQLSCVQGGPQTDFTNMGQCKGKGFFMHFNTARAYSGEQGFLESRWLYPKPGPQCLQFFLYNTGADDDVLEILVREYDKDNSDGKLKHFKSISGGEKGTWTFHNVNLNMTGKSRVVFKALRGRRSSNGGLSLDDINLSSTTCPHHIWHLRNITNLMATTPAGSDLYSPRFLSPSGYSFQVSLNPNGYSTSPEDMAIYLHLTSGPNDQNLKWPCAWQMATMALMDQQSDIRQQMTMHNMITTDPSKMTSDGTKFYWDDPRKVGSEVTDTDGSSYYRGPGYGTRTFLSHSRLKSRNFIKGDTAIFLLSLEDISHLLEPQPLPQIAVRADAGLLKVADQNADQEAANKTSVILVLAACATAFMLVVSVVMAVIICRKRKKEGYDVLLNTDTSGFMEENSSKGQLLSLP